MIAKFPELSRSFPKYPIHPLDWNQIGPQEHSESPGEKKSNLDFWIFLPVVKSLLTAISYIMLFTCLQSLK